MKVWSGGTSLRWRDNDDGLLGGREAKRWGRMVLQGCVHRITVDVVVVQGREGRCVFISHLPAGVRVCKEWEAEKYRKEWSTK